MTTLAEMTPQERKECVGMWAETSNGLAIIIEPFYTDGVLDTTVVFSLKPEVKIEQRIAAYVTPRPDLIRAWSVDGEPLEADWQYAEYQPGVNRGFYTIEETIEKGPEMAEGTTAARRWVGEWETAEEDEEA